ncbi:MAG: ABC transporter permease [Thermomicrobiales bacterium]|nr:ABC transporter permease [Thermomicrobiales bacterium]
MTRYLAGKLVAAIPVLLLVSALVFALQVINPGDPITLLVPLDTLQSMSAEDIDRVRARYGLDESIPEQYGRWLMNLLQGDLGVSLRSREPVVDIIRERLPITFELAVLSLGVSIAVAIPAGIFSAYRRNSLQDTITTGVSLAGVSVPNFWLALVLILMFSVRLGWLPPSGYVPFRENPAENLRYMVLPVLTLSSALMAQTMRLTRSSMLEVLGQDYVTTARAKGLAEPIVMRRHALKNAMTPVVTVIGLQFGALLGGTLIIEQIFAIPGIGKAAVDAVFNKDYPVVQGIVIVAVITRITTNMLSDIVVAYLDPRVKLN